MDQREDFTIKGKCYMVCKFKKLIYYLNKFYGTDTLSLMIL